MSFRGGLLDPRPNFQVVGIQWKSASEILVQDHPEGTLSFLFLVFFLFLILILGFALLILVLSPSQRYPGADDGSSAADDLPGDFGPFLTAASIFVIPLSFLTDIIS